MLKNVKFISFMLVMVLMLAACGSGENANSGSADGGTDSFLIKFASPLSEDHPGHAAIMEFKELAEEKSEGALTIEVHGNGVLGGDRELTESVQRGTLEMTVSSTSPVANFDPSFYVFDLPFLFENLEMTYEVLDGEVGQEILDNLAGQGIKGLGYWENGFRHITTSNRPIHEMADMKGLKIRTMENQLHLEAWKQFGANPTPMAFGELFAAMQQGTVDGQENPLALIDANKFYEVQDYLTLSGHIYTPFVVMINDEYYNNLPENLQQIILDSMKEATEFQRALMVEEEEKSLQIIKDSGTEVIELSDDVRQQLVEASQPIYETGAELVGGQELIDKLLNAIEAAKNG